MKSCHSSTLGGPDFGTLLSTDFAGESITERFEGFGVEDDIGDDESPNGELEEVPKGSSSSTTSVSQSSSLGWLFLWAGFAAGRTLFLGLGLASPT